MFINLIGMDPNTLTGFTFFVVNMALLASALFFWLERDNVNPKWKTSLTVSGLVCFIAAVHYFYMRESVGIETVAIRYIDWLITVPLLMIELYIVLLAVTKVSSSVFQKLLGYTTLMLVFGYLGESGAVAAIDSTIGFVGGMLFWGLALREIWSGEAAEANAGSKNAAGHYAYDRIKKIVTFGWIIYPVGYAWGYFGGGLEDVPVMVDGVPVMVDGVEKMVANPNYNIVNQIYNLADFVNKILPGVIVWAAARMDTK